ncbi:hypothetical protein UlMin_026385 [Ulmus minor]
MAPEQKLKTSPNTTITTIPQSSKSSETIADNDDLLREILVKLPLKSLMKFTSVSKHWLSLISHPDFNRRRNPFPCSVSGLFLPLFDRSIGNSLEYEFVDLNQSSNPTNPPFRSLSFTNNPSGMGIKIVHSCNGLLLCSGTEIYVYNPTTKKYTVLPPLPPPSRFYVGLNLAFDPSNSPYYKVLCVCKIDNCYRIEIYSSKTGIWRLSGISFHANNLINFQRGVFWNGAVHWTCLRKPSLYFNVEEERLSRMPLPPVSKYDNRVRYLRYFGESRGHLHLIDHFYTFSALQFDVYEMEMDYSFWFVKFRIDFSEFPTAFPEMVSSYRPDLRLYHFSILYIFRDDVDEESYVVIRIPGKVVRYNFQSKAFHKLCDIEPSNSTEIPCFLAKRGGHQYIESLALV